jgi:conjugal transfer pilus assembly protein TraD
MAGAERQPKTWYNDRDEDQPAATFDELWVRAGLAVLLLVAAPAACLVAVVCVAGTILARLRWWWPLVLAGAGVTWLLVGVGFGDASRGYLAAYLELGRAVVHRDLQLRWVDWLAGQLPLALPAGALVAAAVTGWTELRRPSWRTRPRRRGLGTFARIWLVSYLIASGRLVAFAVDRRGRPVRLSHDEATGNVLAVGIPDCGKTVTCLQLMLRAIRDGLPIIVIDLKGSPKVARPLAKWARQYGRPFWLFSFEGPCTYDPLVRGDATRRKDLVIGAGDWPDEGPATYFRKVAGDYLQTVFQVMDATPQAGRSALDEVVELLDPRTLAARAAAGAGELLAGDAQQWTERLTTEERSALAGLRHRVGELARSTAGAWLRSRPDAAAVDLAEVVAVGGVACFSLDALNYEEVASALAGLIVQDCKTLAGDLILAETDPASYVWVDEFSALKTDNLLGLLNKCREAGMRVVLTTQSLADLLQHHQALLRRVIDLTNVKLIHLTNDPESAQLLSELAGTDPGFDERIEVAQRTGLPGAWGTGSATGRSLLNPADKPRVQPGVIMELGNGQCVLVVKQPKLRVVGPVRVVPVRGTLLEGRSRPAGQSAAAQPSEVITIGGSLPHAAAWQLAAPPTGDDAAEPTDVDADAAEPTDVDADGDGSAAGGDGVPAGRPDAPSATLFNPNDWEDQP